MSLTEEQRQKINKFIAEKRGWTHIHAFNKHKEGGTQNHRDGDLVGDYFNGVTRRHAPDYTRSLDACHEAAMGLDRNSLAYSDYYSRLNATVAIENSRSGARPIKSIDATAEQRTLALFQTLGGQL